jgi:hypothetical protein
LCAGELGCCDSIRRVCTAAIAGHDGSGGFPEVVGGAVVGVPFLDEHFHSGPPHSTSHPFQASSRMECGGCAVERDRALRVPCVVRHRCWHWVVRRIRRNDLGKVFAVLRVEIGLEVNNI